MLHINRPVAALVRERTNPFWLSGCIGFALASAATAPVAQPLATAVTQEASPAVLAAAMRSAATALLAATPAAERPRLAYPFDAELRADWHYTPRSRAGLALKDMSAAQRSAARALLAAPLSLPGLALVDEVMALELVLRELEAGSSLRVPQNYAIALYGQPDPSGAWGWRIEGHHLSLHITLQGDAVVSTLPQFIGANPALVARTVEGGPPPGSRPLGAIEDAARALLDSLSQTQRGQAIISQQTYGDLVSRNASKAAPLDKAGIEFAALNASQQTALLALVEQFAATLKPALAVQRLQRVRSSGAQSLQFAWVGSAQKGRGHYFRIQGSTFLIEYDNSGGNHVHSVWRDFDGDWGRDVLADHYRRSR